MTRPYETTPDHDARMLRHRLEILLGDIPAIVDNGETTFTRQTMGGSGGGNKSDEWVPFNEKMGDALTALKGVLVSWARMVSEEQLEAQERRNTLALAAWQARARTKPDLAPYVPSDNPRYTLTCRDSSASVAAWLMHHTRWLSRHPAGLEMEDEIKGASDAITRLSDIHLDERIFIGYHGEIPIYAKLGQTEIVLFDGTKIDVALQRDTLVKRLLARPLPPKQCAHVVRFYGGVKVTEQQINRWYSTDSIRRAKLTHSFIGPLSREQYGLNYDYVAEKRKHYLPAEVVARAATAATRKAERQARLDAQKEHADAA